MLLMGWLIINLAYFFALHNFLFAEISTFALAMSIVCTIDLIAQMTGHKSAIFALEPASAEPDILYAGDGDGWIVRWDIRSPQLGRAVAKVPSNVFSLCLKSDAQMAVGTLGGACYWLNLAQSSLPIGNVLLPKAIFAVKTYADYFLLCCGDGSLYSTARSSTQFQSALPVAAQIPIAKANLRQIALHPYLPLAAVACSDGLIYILSLPEFTILDSLAFHKNGVFSLVFSPCGKYLLSGSRDAFVAVWQYNKSGQIFNLIHSIPAHLFTINAISYSPDGQLFATGSRDKTIKIWHAATFRLLKVIDTAKFGNDAPTRSVNTMLWLPMLANSGASYRLVAAGDERKLWAWSVNIG